MNPKKTSQGIRSFGKGDMRESPIFTPDNEPYLGRKSVFHFDQVILSCLETDAQISAYTHKHKNELTDLQKAACQIIPQGINIALSIRELIRQGYLFGAAVLMRPLIERAAIISYLCEKPESVDIWKNGWKYGERPSFGEMLITMNANSDKKQRKDICDTFNSLTHGDPMSAGFNLVNLPEGGMGYSVSKTLHEPEFCDFICFQAYLFLIVIMGRRTSCFPGIPTKDSVPPTEAEI